MSSSFEGSAAFLRPPPRTIEVSPTTATAPCTFGISGFQTVAGATSYPIASFRGPTRRSYTAAILCRQFPAASAKSFGVISTCTSFSACTNVSTDTSGPEPGEVPNAAGAPGVLGICGPNGTCGTCPATPRSATFPATTAATNPIEPFAKNSLRERAIPNLRTLSALKPCSQIYHPASNPPRNHRHLDRSITLLFL